MPFLHFQAFDSLCIFAGLLKLLQLEQAEKLQVHPSSKPSEGVGLHSLKCPKTLSCWKQEVTTLVSKGLTNSPCKPHVSHVDKEDRLALFLEMSM